MTNRIAFVGGGNMAMALFKSGGGIRFDFTLTADPGHSFQITDALASLSDLPVIRWYYQASLENLMRTFLGKFGWGHVLLLGSKPYLFLGILLGLAGIGALLGLWRQRRSLDWHALAWLE